MKEHPIIFSAPMVRAILDGRKTQTRRVMKVQPWLQAAPIYPHDVVFCLPTHSPQITRCLGSTNLIALCPYGKTGDQFWVRENAKLVSIGPNESRGVTYPADGRMGAVHDYEKPTDAKDMKPLRITPSIHVPRWASRIWLEIVDIRVERLNDISTEDALAEGLKAVTKDAGRTVKYGIPDLDGWPGTDNHGWPWDEWQLGPVLAFRHLWNKINGSGAWAQNPFVWVVEFERVKS